MTLKQIEYCTSTIDTAITSSSVYLAFVLLQSLNSTAMFSNNRNLYPTTHYTFQGVGKTTVNKQFALDHHFTFLAFSIIWHLADTFMSSDL